MAASISFRVWRSGLLLLSLLIACQKTLPPTESQKIVQAAWLKNWHGVWELNWQNAPYQGAIIFEAWHFENEVRYEILEAPLADLVGLVYVKNKNQAFQYNRLKSPEQFQQISGPPRFSPLSDAFSLTESYLFAEKAHAASLSDQDDSQAVYELQFEQGVFLRFWLDQAEEKVFRLHFRGADQNFSLAARSLEPLAVPHPRLFEPPALE